MEETMENIIQVEEWNAQDTLWAELPKCYSDSSIPEYK